MLSASYLTLYHSPIDTTHPNVNKVILHLTPNDTAHPDAQMLTRWGEDQGVAVEGLGTL